MRRVSFIGSSKLPPHATGEERAHVRVSVEPHGSISKELSEARDVFLLRKRQRLEIKRVGNDHDKR